MRLSQGANLWLYFKTESRITIRNNKEHVVICSPQKICSPNWYKMDCFFVCKNANMYGDRRFSLIIFNISFISNDVLFKMWPQLVSDFYSESRFIRFLFVYEIARATFFLNREIVKFATLCLLDLLELFSLLHEIIVWKTKQKTHIEMYKCVNNKYIYKHISGCARIQGSKILQ